MQKSKFRRKGAAASAPFSFVREQSEIQGFANYVMESHYGINGFFNPIKIK
jgi:hypothetical protein